jgi:hypothetical protein
MSNFKSKSQALSAFFLLAISMSVFGGDFSTDGNWWLSLPKNVRAVYVAGFFDGKELGHNFSTWKYLSPNASKAEQASVNKARQSYSEYSQKYSHNITFDQLVDGLDSFYSDYRNRRIQLSGGVWLVLNAVAGTPEDELNKMIENWRKN